MNFLEISKYEKVHIYLKIFPKWPLEDASLSFSAGNVYAREISVVCESPCRKFVCESPFQNFVSESTRGPKRKLETG